MSKFVGLVIAAISAVSLSVFANEVQKVEEKLQGTFTNYKITWIQESPIPGVYEVHAGSQIHYYAPEQNLLLFGQIYSAAGENLTEAAKIKEIQRQRESLPLDSAIQVQSGDISITEITNPDCGYCQKYEKWISQMSAVYSIERKVIFMQSANFPDAKQKMMAVVCSKNKKSAYEDVMTGKSNPNSNCVEGESILAQHNSITEKLGVQGTPTFLLPDGSVITGFKPVQIEKYLLDAASKLSPTVNQGN